MQTFNELQKYLHHFMNSFLYHETLFMTVTSAWAGNLYAYSSPEAEKSIVNDFTTVYFSPGRT